MSDCGSCSLCCRLLGIRSINKLPGVWCQFCAPGRGGCKIHDQPDFPSDCADYVCLWLQCRQEGRALPDDMRPDRSKVIIDARKYEKNVHNVRCDPMHPDAWRQPRVQSVLAALAEAGSTLYLVTPAGEERKLRIVKNG